MFVQKEVTVCDTCREELDGTHFAFSVYYTPDDEHVVHFCDDSECIPDALAALLPEELRPLQFLPYKTDLAGQTFQVKPITVNECLYPGCDFVGKTESGLRTHATRKHGKKG